MRIGENITHRADGRWEARYIKGRNPDGCAIYGFCYGKTHDEAIQKRNDAELLSKNAAIEAPKSFGDIYAMISGTSVDDDTARFAEKFVLPQISMTPINAISDSDLAAVMQEIKRKSTAFNVKKCFELLKNIFDYAVAEDYLLASPIGTLTISYRSGRKSIVTKGFLPITEQEYLTNEQAKELETRLIDGVNSRNPGINVGLYLCFQLGLLRNEVGSLQLKDIDFKKGTLSINKILSKRLVIIENISAYECIPVEERIIPLPKYVLDFLSSISHRYLSPNSYLVCNKSGIQCTSYDYIRELKVIKSNSNTFSHLDMDTLRDTFIVRCIRNGIDVFTITELTGIQSIADIQSRYGELFKTKTEDICSFESYSTGTRFDRNEPEKMNLLILGAGGYGHTVKEIAEKIGVFSKISFLDDDNTISESIDLCTNFKRYKNYPCAFPAFGDCTLRKHWIDVLSSENFIVPRIIDPTATISLSAVIADAVVIEANATVNAQAHIERGCIISSGALVDRGAVVREAVHVDCSSTVAKDSIVPELRKIASGTVFDSNR